MIEVFKNKMEYLTNELSKEQLSSIHYRSVNNFLQYYNQLKSDSIKEEVIVLLKEYFSEIENLNYNLSRANSSEIFRKYIMKIGTYYNDQLNFQSYIQPKWALFIGLNIDVILLILGLLKKIHYVPIVTICFTSYFIYLRIRYGNRQKLYGTGY